MNTFINETLMPPMMKFLNTKAVTAIKNGMMYILPAVIVGSIFLILGQLPWQAGQDFMNKIKLGPLFLAINNASFGIMALFAVFGIAYSWVEAEGYKAAPAGLIAIICDIVLQPDIMTNVTSIATGKPSSNYYVYNVIDRTWLSGKGMVLAIIVGLIVGWLYSWFMKHNITIKMPEQVPENVAGSFTALIPTAAIVTLFGILEGIYTIALNTTFVEWVYKVIQSPLQHVSDGPVGVFVLAFLPVFIWWFGVHGSSIIITGIMAPLLAANGLDNAKLYAEHKLSLANGAHIVTQAFSDQFIISTGAGLTFGLVVYLLFFAKSQQMKVLGRMELGPAIFNINEPVLFGLPIVLNPILAIPFFLAPLLSGFLTYFAIYFQIIPPFNGVYVPWTTPPIISGLLVGGWKTAIWQALMLVMTIFIYFPFARSYDKILLAQEQENQAEEES